MASNGLASPPLPGRDGVTPGPLSPTGTSTPGSVGRSSNPLSSKVTSVLSTSYADAEFRESLALLDERGISNTAETRRQLRLDVQKEVIDSNGKIITEFGRVAEQLRRIGTTIDKLNKSYQEMRGHVTTAHESTSTMLEEASSLMTQRRNIETKQQVLKAFREHFVLSEDEVAWLTLTAEPVDDRFFAVLAKAKRIRKDCEFLLGFESQTLGLEIMDQTSKNLNQAFQKLYRWVQKEFKTLNLENPQINSSVRRAIRVLAERPSLFQSCLDFFAEAREQILSDAFYLALTGTSASGTKDHSVKPIELVAHDPLRYAGDMLAWTHSAAVSEREALEILFISDGNEIAKGIQEGRENELWNLMADEADGPPEFDAVKALNELVDRDVSGAARILRQRVEQVIQTNEETILAYKLANLLSFYRVTFSKLLGADSVLLQSMANLESEALRQFRSLMRDHITTLEGEFQHTPSDLGPPEFLQEALKQLTAIMRTYETSLAADDDNREAEFEPVLAESFDPFMSGCENMSKNVSPPSDSIFLLNCLLAAQSALEPFTAFTSTRLARLRSIIDSHSARLIDSQYAFFRTGSALEPLFTALDPLSDARGDDVLQVADGKLDVLQAEALVHAAQGLDDFLPSAVMDALENVKHLQDAKLARYVTEEAAERFCADFEHVEELLVAADELIEEREEHQTGVGLGIELGVNTGAGEEGEKPRLRALFPRTTGEIRVLLS
ncbi:oligomeric Golgi complex subunit 6 [Hypoxylon trugodes]|uniref:oligomeric Golgi complex subunit 6 n=1 Tax=Hypoxylon trugodes TaxID=326681 RepID=UPI0021945C65|nr:oligomeric Golgi complex subunit 6 [Hypoxylon trugodes]KAI1385265.1 oligomeric Golgi complex subunit 6 [Hypoxylon trugodes]